MASDHPFQILFETLGRVPSAHAETVNRQASEVLADILSVPVEKSGRCILLRAPRAGHGKTHLLSRIQHRLGADHEFIPLHAAFGCRIDATTVTNDALRQLVRQLPASGGLTILDLVTRRLFASALQPLVGSGEVPCQDREGALTALRARPIETFDFHHPNAVTAHWARENFEVLGQRLSHELAQRAGLPVREVSFWVDALFRFASAPLENSSRVRALAEAVPGQGGAEMERLEALLGLLTMLTRVVLVADDLEGFSTDETAALRLASFLGSLRQSVERLDVILSVNRDIWESAFVPRLSGGLADRLSEIVVELEPLTEQEMAALLDSRVPGLGSRVLEKVDRNAAGTHARGLIQAAGMAWLKATAMDASSSPVTTPVQAPSLPPVEQPIPEIVPPVSEAAVREESSSAPVAEQPPVFTFNPPPSASPAPDDEETSWPAPDFTPPPVVAAAAPEPVFTASPVESPVEPSNPVGDTFSPVSTAGQPSSVQPSEWQTAVQVTPEENPWNPPVSPHESSSPFTPVQQSVDSPFTTVQEPHFQTTESAAWQEAQPSETFNPAAESPFQAAPQAAFGTVVPEPVGYFESSTPAGGVADSPFQMAQPDAQAVPNFAQEPSPVFGAAQNFEEPAVQIFQPARILSPENAGQPFPPTRDFSAETSPFQPASVSIPETSPFEAAAQPPAQEQPSPFSVAPQSPPVEATAESTAGSGSPDTDRVDDLLRQFRERYGRGSL